MLQELPGTRYEIYEQHLVASSFAPSARGLADAARVRPGERVLDVPCGIGLSNTNG